MTDEERQAVFDEFIADRGVDTPCENCNGLGTICYPDSNTWRESSGRVVLRMFTHDVCNVCWGTGDEHRHGVNLQEIEATTNLRIAQVTVDRLARVAGATLKVSRKAVDALREQLELLAQKGKEYPPYFSKICRALADTLSHGVQSDRLLSDDAESGGTGTE